MDIFEDVDLNDLPKANQEACVRTGIRTQEFPAYRAKSKLSLLPFTLKRIVPTNSLQISYKIDPLLFRSLILLVMSQP